MILSFMLDSPMLDLVLHPSPNSSPQAISKLCYPRSGWLLDGVAPSRFRD
jgi:hypothetical protein